MSIKDWIIKKLGGYTSNEYSKLNNLYKTTHKEKEKFFEINWYFTQSGLYELIARNLLEAIKIYEDKDFINLDEEPYRNIVCISYEIRGILQNCKNYKFFEKSLLLKTEEMKSSDYCKKVREKEAKGRQIFQEKQKGEIEK
ncbi:hypothetical protein [Aliarcobacter butzleri]|uniref:hypothetical protein n=1 Tax=Aliarcobacter butzleri TaxID=28197 RepID=UPI001587F13E|nr:hypothetical protein [Aliarcobacter butzleri]NUW29445.1 hypothetical protein [Aliarcobacter butzleri]